MTSIRSQLHVAASPADVQALLRDPQRTNAWVVGTPTLICSAATVKNSAWTWQTRFHVTVSQHHILTLHALVTINLSEEDGSTQIVHRVDYTVPLTNQLINRRLALLLQRVITKNVRLSLFGAKALIERDEYKD